MSEEKLQKVQEIEEEYNVEVDVGTNDEDENSSDSSYSDLEELEEQAAKLDQMAEEAAKPSESEIKPDAEYSLMEGSDTGQMSWYDPFTGFGPQLTFKRNIDFNYDSKIIRGDYSFYNVGNIESYLTGASNVTWEQTSATHSFSSEVVPTVIDGGSNNVIATVAVGSSPRGVGVNPTTSRIYVGNLNTDNVSVIDGGANNVIATVAVGSGPTGVGVNPTTNRIYIANIFSNNVSVIDGGSNSVIATVAVGSSPRGVGVNPLTNGIYVANADNNNVSVISGNTNMVIATIPVGVFPDGVGVNP
ncbi:YncE family protein [Alteribacillus sp. HJP-4]|uniref:YncE family protein n=1 Tax=Alteribacillus sp. HJP-4 TaxID=2775394 RepID=UPI0035CCEE52